MFSKIAGLQMQLLSVGLLVSRMRAVQTA